LVASRSVGLAARYVLDNRDAMVRRRDPAHIKKSSSGFWRPQRKPRRHSKLRAPNMNDASGP
jgi:hypothetical protein